MRRIRVAAWMVLGSLFLCSTPFLGETPAVRGESGLIPNSKIDAFKRALEKRGFAVTEKSFRPADVVYLCCNGYIQSCYGNNAGAPYLTFTSKQGTIDVPEEQLMGEQDAMVLVGKTPPPVKYFSYRSYLFSRYDPVNPDRDILFLSLGDTINVDTIKTGAPQGTKPFGQSVIVVSTPDQTTDSLVKAAAEDAGFPGGIVNTDVIPASITQLGQQEPADHFVLLHRLMLPLPGHESEVQAYMDSPPYRAFKITPAGTSRPPKPFPMPKLTPRGTGTNEMDYMPSLQALRAAILAHYPGAATQDLTTGIWINEGMDGLQRNANLLGEVRDTTYLSTSNFTLLDDPNQFVIVYGLNHDLTKKATYSNFSVYGDTLKVGITGKSSPDLYNSACGLIPGDPNQDKFYVFKVARECGGDPSIPCLKIEPSVTCPKLDLNGDLFIAFRAYLEKKTGTGPVWTELLYDRAVKVTLGP